MSRGALARFATAGHGFGGRGIALAGAVAAGCGQPSATQPHTGDDLPIDAGIDARPMTTLDVCPYAPAVGAGPTPDLQFIAKEMVTTPVVTAEDFAADDCAVVEGCVGAAGHRVLLRFDTVTANCGTANLVVGPTPPPGQSTATFQWSQCHMHHHVANYTSYELVGTTGITITARKQSFCLEDDEQILPGSRPTGYSCLNQGISRGWADVYGRFLACQWIDVTDVAPGDYMLRVVVNPLHTLPESNYDNNVFTVPVKLPDQGIAAGSSAGTATAVDGLSRSNAWTTWR